MAMEYMAGTLCTTSLPDFPGMDIASERIAIRPWTLHDVDSLHAIVSDPRTMAYWPAPFSLGETIAWIERSMRHLDDCGYSRCALVHRPTGKVIGDVGLLRGFVAGHNVVDLGYIVDHPWWGQGLGTEGATMVRDFAFGSGLEVLHANMAHDHLASRRIAEKIGMRVVLEFNNPRNRGIRSTLMEVRRGWLLDHP